MAEAILRPVAYTGPTLTDEDGNEIIFDVMKGESSSTKVEWTKHPLESGAKTADHAVVQPRTVVLSVAFTNTPTRTSEAAVADRDIKLYNQLEAIAIAKQRVTVITTMKVYKGYGITDVSPSRTSDTGQKIPLSVSLEEVQFSSTEQVEVPATVIKARAQKMAAPKVNGGKQTGTDLGTSTTDAQASGITADSSRRLSGADTQDIGTGTTTTADPAAPEKEVAAEKKTSRLKNLLRGT